MSTGPKPIFEVPVAQTDDPFAQLLRGEVKSPELTGNFQIQWTDTYGPGGRLSSFEFSDMTTGRIEFKIGDIAQQALYEAELKDRDRRAKKEFFSHFDHEYLTGFGLAPIPREHDPRRLCPICGGRDPSCRYTRFSKY